MRNLRRTVLILSGLLPLLESGNRCSPSARLSEIGMIDVSRRGLGWRMWWSGPWLPTRLVTATKPLGRSIGASTLLTVRSPA